MSLQKPRRNATRLYQVYETRRLVVPDRIRQEIDPKPENPVPFAAKLRVTANTMTLGSAYGIEPCYRREEQRSEIERHPTL